MGFKALIQQGINAIKNKTTQGGTAPEVVYYDTLIRAAKAVTENTTGFYSVSPEDWYKTYPYRFKIMSKQTSGKKPTYYSLPIPPEALSYQMVAASQLIPTLGGVIEETSATVFWQITLTGTTGTGISRRYNKEGKDSPDTLDMPASQEENFRKVLKGGILANTFNKFANAYDAVTGAGEGTNAALGLLEGLASTAQRFNSSAVKTALPPSDTSTRVANALNLDLSPFREKAQATNGYVEIHLLHNFLNAYSHLKEQDPENTELYFESHKDNMQWRVIVKAFSFQKNANQPYVYRYNIALQGFDLKEVGASERKAIDRFGVNGDLGGVNSFTLSGALERAKALQRKLENKQSLSDYGSLIASKPPVI